MCPETLSYTQVQFLPLGYNHASKQNTVWCQSVTAVRVRKARVVSDSRSLLGCRTDSYKTYSKLQSTAVQWMTYAHVRHSLIAISIIYLAIQMISTKAHTNINLKQNTF